MTKFAGDSGARVDELKGAVKWDPVVKDELLDQLLWYRRANLSSAIEKTEVLPLGVSIKDIEIGETNIKPSLSIKFFSFMLQSNRKFDIMVN